MKPEIEDLIEIYGNKEKYRQRIIDVAKKTPIPDLAEALDVQDKINFGKNRQRAELLKQNEDFLKELSGIKNRLGEKFFKLMEDEITMEGNLIEASSEAALLKSDFAEPKIIIQLMSSPEPGAELDIWYCLPGTLPGTGSEIDLMCDSFFDGPPLEWVILDEDNEIFNPTCKRIETPAFKLRCKKKVFNRYLDKWIEFLTKWHISREWNGDLQYLYVHSLPSVIVERDDESHNLPVVIRLGAWATLEDVKEAWTTVERTMKEAHIYRERESENFLRDHIWSQLNKRESMSPLNIARFWAEKFPKEIDLEVIEKLARADDTFEKEKPEGLLEEINSDPYMGELKGRFIEARKAFIKTGLKDRVKKSIKKTEEKIRRLGSEDWDRNRAKIFRRAEPVPKTGEK